MNQADTGTKPTPVDTHVPEKQTHKFCRCQWPEGPGISTSICGKTLPIEGRPVNPHDNRCKDCLEVTGLYHCPICDRTLWAG